eukprot:g9994.t1
MIQEEVTRLRREADNWVLAVDELRRQYPLLNDYTMHQLQRELARFTPAPLARSVSGLNTTAVGLLKQLAEAWTNTKQRESMLRPLAASSNYTGDQTTGGAPTLGGYGASFPPGLSLVVGDPLEQCVVAFAKAGFLPEWTHVLVYVEGVTTWEEVQIFLYRWALQHQSKTKAADGGEVPTCPFCVCGVDYLRGEWYFQLQQEIQKLSDEHEATHGAKPPPLLLISSTPDHVAAKLHAHLRLELRAETRIFQSVKRSLGYFEDDHEETTTAVGGSGGGKSAFARRRARGKRYVYLPLYANSDVATREGVIRYLKRETSPDAATREATFLHVDVLDSFVSPVVEDLLFHLIVLQRLCVRDLLWERPRKNVVFDIFVELPNSGWVKKSAFLRSAVGRFDVAPGDVFSCDWSPLTVGATDADPGSGLAPVAERDSQRASLGTGGAAADLAQASYNNNERRDCILRLKVVCLCLKAREDNLGGFPADWKKDLLQLSQKLMPLLRSDADPQGRKSAQGANMGYSDAILTELFTTSGYSAALRQMKELNPTAVAHADFSAALALDSTDCLGLLLRAAQVTRIDRNAAASCDWRVSGSLWSLWSFVHLLYDGLCRLASHESERGTFSNMVGGRTGEQLRGQVIGFLCRTAAEVAFARRRNNAAPANGNANYPDVQELTAAPDRAPWLRFSVSANSWLYERCQFDHELKPVYRMGSLMDPSYVYASHEFPPTLVPDVGVAPTPTGAERSENAEPQVAQEQFYWLLGGGDISRLGNRVDYLSTDSNLEVASAWRTAEEVKRGVAASMSAFSVRLCAEPQANAGAGPVLRHAPRRDEDERLLEELFSTGDLLPWSASNHEMLLTAEREVFFLASNSLELRKRMHPRLVELLDRADVPVGNDLQKLTSNKTGILTRMLAALTNMNADSVKPLPAPLRNFVLTGDVVLKLLAIYLRVRNQIPVILLGECGCGKTHMLRYLCAWLGVGLVVEDVHGGTTENDIASAVRRADALLARTSRTAQTRPVASTDTGTPDHDEVDHGGSDGEEVFKAVYLFFDEMNTCGHMGLIAEVIMHRSMKGRSIDPRIQILAACNPYRKYPPNAAMLQRSAGMEFGAQSGTCSKSTENRNQSGDPANIPRDLVYRVHPIPTCLKQFVFDFGALSDVSELQFITSMVRSEYPQPVSDPAATQVLIGWLEVAQRYVREVEGDVSVVSLRDVARCLKLCKWFAKYAGAAGGSSGAGSTSGSGGLGSAQVATKVGAAKAKAANKGAAGNIRPKTNASSAASQQRRGTFEVLAIAHVYYFRLPAEERAELLSRLRLRLGLALTRAKEKDGEGNELEKNWKWLFPPNVMAKVIAKTAKSLASKFELEPGIALNDALTENLYVSFVAICNKIPIFIVGKPGSSKTLTLQILTSNLRGEQSSGSYWRKFPSIYVFPYQCSPFSTAAGILQQFRIAVNYSRKAKRAMTCLLLDEIGLAEHSPDLPLKVLHGILISPPIAIVGLSNWALDAAKMNRAILLNRTDPKADDVELTGSCIVAAGSTADLSTWLVAISQAYSKIYAEQEGRNFVGMRDYYQMLKLIRRLFLQLKASVDAACVDVKDETPLIESNLCDPDARHLMLLSDVQGSALEILFQTKLLRRGETEVLMGSPFSDDKNELSLIQHVNRVKEAMATGKTVVLWNLDTVYESLYDVLNQRFVVRRNKAASGAVVGAAEDGSGGGGTERAASVTKMLRIAIGPRSQLCPVHADGFRIVTIVERTHAYEKLDLPLLNRFEKQTLGYRDVVDEAAFARAKAYVAEVAVAMPAGSSSGNADGTSRFSSVFTHTPMMPLEHVLSHQSRSSTEDERTQRTPPRFQCLRLSEVASQVQLVALCERFWSAGNEEAEVLFVQCDGRSSERVVIEHAKRLVVQSWVDHGRHIESTTTTAKKRVVFVIHAQPGQHMLLSGDERAKTPRQHVSWAIGELSTGSLKVSLEVVIESYLLQILSHWGQFLDVNFALRLVGKGGREGGVDVTPHFFTAMCKRFLDIKSLAARFRFETTFAADVREVANTGSLQPFMCRVPFSHKLLPVLEHAVELVRCGDRTSGADAARNGEPVLEFGQTKPEITGVDDARLLAEYDWAGAATGFPPELQDDDDNYSGNTVTAEGAAARGSDDPEEWADEVWLANYFGKDRELAKWLCSAPVVDAYLDDFVQQRMAQYPNVSLETQFRLVKQAICGSSQENGSQSCLRSPLDVHRRHTKERFLIQKKLALLSYFSFDDETTAAFHYESLVPALTSVVTRQVDELLQSSVMGGASAREAYFLKLANFGQDLRDFDDRGGLWIATAARFFLVLQDEASGGREDGAWTTGARAVFSNHMRQYIRGAGGNDESPVSRRTAESFLAMVAAGTEDSAHFRLLVSDLFLDAGPEFFMSSRESSSAHQGSRGKRECDVLFGTLLAGSEKLNLSPLPPRVQRLVAWRLGPQGMAEYEGPGDVSRHCLLWLNVVQDRDEARLPASIDALTEDVLRVNEGVPETAGLRGKLWGGSAAASIRMALWARKYVPQLAKYLLQAVKVGLANCIAGSSELGDADEVPNSGADVAIHSALNILQKEQSSQAASPSKVAEPLHTTHEAFAAAVYEKIQIPSGIFPLIRSSEHVRLFFFQCLHRFGAFEGICEVFSCMPPTVIKELGYVKNVDFASLERAANLFTAEMYQDVGALMLHRSAELPAGIAVDAHGRTAKGAVPAQDSCEQKQAYREAFKLSARNDFALRTCFCEGGQIENGAEQQSGRLLCFEEVCASFAFSARVSGCLFPATKEQEHDRLRGRLFDEKVVRQALRAVERNPATAGKIGERERIFASEKVEASGVTFLSPACKSDSDSLLRSGELLYLWLYRVCGPHFKHHRSAFFLQPAGRRDDGPAVSVSTGSSSPTTTTILPNLPGVFPAKISLASFAFHFLKLITRHPDSFYYSLLTQPEACRSSFLPGCPGSEMALVIRGMQEQVTWYRCPNGHLYTVGNCGMPMQQSRCSQCGAAIGGNDHRPTGQQTRLGRATEVGAALETPGYVLDLKDPRVSPAADVVQQRLFTVRAARPGSQDAAAINLHRLLLHLALLLSCEVFGDERHVEMLVRSGTARGGNNGATLKKRILGHITHSWEACRRELNTKMHSALSDQEFSLFLHVLLLKLDPIVERSRAFFPEMAAMLRFEEAVAHAVLELRANWGVEAKKACGGEQEAEAGKSAVLFETAVRQAFGDDVVAKLVATEQVPAAAPVNAAAAPRGNVAPSRSLAERFDPAARSSTSTSTDSSVSSILPVLLQLREPMSLERFLAQIIPAASPNFLGEKCPFLMRFLRLESRLHLCKFAADILDWTQVLCGDYDGRAGDGSGGPNATLARPRGLLGHQKRADASTFTLQPEDDHDAASSSGDPGGVSATTGFSSSARNGSFLAGASHLISRDEAYRTPMRASASTPARQLKLARFLRAFNEGLPWLPTLYECQRNPFLATDADGNPTVSIDGEKLQPDSPIVFGLPSQPPQTRAVDPSGLCVLRLLDFFGRTNNELLEELASLDGGSSRLVNRGGQTRTAFGDGASMIDTRSVLELHLETPCDDARRRLIHYDRADDLLPLLHEFFGEETEDASKAEGIHGLLLAFQSAVKRRVIFRKNISRVQVLVRQFLYRGELRARGSLGVLGRMVAQSGVLPFTVHKRLEDDVSNCRERHRQLTALVERVIQSLVVFGLGAAASGETPLRDYLREALPDGSADGGASTWAEDEGHDIAILGDVQLRHLGALYLALETIGSGGADSRFLPQSLQQVLRDRYQGVLRDLLCGPLSDPETQYDGGESLKLFLEYADTDLEQDSTFRDHFPDALALSHSLELLRMLCGGR